MAFNYTNRDFSSIKDDLLARASQTLPEWTDRNSSDFMMALIDLWAYSADVLHFYVDRAATEAFLTTATQRESVLALANLYDYTPNFRTSAISSVAFTNTSASTTVIPAGTSLYALEDDSRTYFYTISDLSLSAGETASVTVYQGQQFFDQLVSLPNGSSVSNGTSGQRFSIRDANVVPSTVAVDVYEGVGGTPVRWQYDTNLSESGVSDSSYSVYVSSDGYTEIVFGNGVNGRIPPTNAVVRASYTVSDGASGNVAAGTITNLSSPIPFIQILGNANAAFGGINSESIASIKANIPASFRTLGRAVSLSDYQDLALGVQGVSKAKAVYTGSGANGGSVTVHVVTYQSNYTVSSSTAASIAVDSSIRSEVAQELTSASMLGITTIAVPATVLTQRVRITMNVFVKSNYIAQIVKEAVTSAVQALLDFDAVSFGGRLSLGEVYRATMAVEGVDYVTIQEFNLDNSSTLLNVVTADSTKLLQIGSFSVTANGGVVPPGA